MIHLLSETHPLACRARITWRRDAGRHSRLGNSPRPERDAINAEQHNPGFVQHGKSKGRADETTPSASREFRAVISALFLLQVARGYSHRRLVKTRFQETEDGSLPRLQIGASSDPSRVARE
jgi:hypothetical protein